jgi:hypothetical protein
MFSRSVSASNGLSIDASAPRLSRAESAPKADRMSVGGCLGKRGTLPAVRPHLRVNRFRGRPRRGGPGRARGPSPPSPSTVKKKRELFPGPSPASRSSVTSPYDGDGKETGRKDGETPAMRPFPASRRPLPPHTLSFIKLV